MAIVVEDWKQDKRYKSSYNPTHWSCRKCHGSEFVQWSTRKTCVSCLANRKTKYKEQEEDRNTNFKKNYGITLETYNEMLRQQDYKCLICKEPELAISHQTKKPFNLSVDHCHATGRVRGLLCSHCNHGLGRFKDNPDLLQAAIDYLGASNGHYC